MRILKEQFSPETIKWSEGYRILGVSPTIPILDIEDRLRIVEERLFILQQPSKETLEKYPALKNAYEEYKIIENMILESATTR